MKNYWIEQHKTSQAQAIAEQLLHIKFTWQTFRKTIDQELTKQIDAWCDEKQSEKTILR